jgi:hypothetical protein
MAPSVLTIGLATSVFLMDGGGKSIPLIPGMPASADHAMQEVRGSNPPQLTLPARRSCSSAGVAPERRSVCWSDPKGYMSAIPSRPGRWPPRHLAVRASCRASDFTSSSMTA